MLIRNPIKRQMSLAFLSVTIASFAGTSQYVFAQGQGSQTQIQSAAQHNGTTAQQTSNDTQTVDMLDGRSDEESLDLGVLTASCPANAVCVQQVLQHSPADEAGVEAGDYLLSIDGKKVVSPNALNKLISSMARDKEVELTLWRQGKEIDCKVHLASKSGELPKCQDAWLGVMLSNEKDGGVKIEHIVAGSPASESELEDGDILVKAGGSDIKDAQTFLQSLEALGPEDLLQLTVRRDSKVHEVMVKLGSFCDAPMAFVRYLHSNHQDSANHEQQEANSSTELMDRALDDIRIRIRELRDEVQSLKEGKPAKPVAEKQGDVSSSPIINDFKLVSQIDVKLRNETIGNKIRIEDTIPTATITFMVNITSAIRPTMEMDTRHRTVETTTTTDKIAYRTTTVATATTGTAIDLVRAFKSVQTLVYTGTEIVENSCCPSA